MVALWDEANRSPGLTPRAAEALKPFIDTALMLERNGKLVGPDSAMLSAGLSLTEWRELLAAFRESMRVEEGITGGDATAKEIGGG